MPRTYPTHLGAGGVFSIKDSAATFLTLRQSDGFIGIGTLTPQSKFDVNGNAKVSGSLNPAGGIDATNSITIQTMANSLIIRAGNSEIILRSNGEVAISANSLVLNSKGVLKLTGTQVDISASSSLKLTCTEDTELLSTGVTIIKGSLVKIN